MSTIKSDTADLTLNADGASSSLKLQIDGVEKASVSTAGAFTSTSIDATKLTGALPAISGASLTSLTSGNLSGALPAISGASLTSLTSGNLSGALPAISGASLTNLPAGGVAGVTTDSASGTAMYVSSANKVGMGGGVMTSSAYPRYQLHLDESTSSSGSYFPLGISGSSHLTGYGVGIAFNPENTSHLAKVGIIVEGNGQGYEWGDLHFCNLGDPALTTTVVGLSDSRMKITKNAVQVNPASSFTSGLPTTALSVGTTYRDSIFNVSTTDSNRYAFKLNCKRASGNTGRLIEFHENTPTYGNPMGSIQSNGGGVSYNTSSDYRLKENIIPLTDSIERVKALNVYRFNFITNPDTTVDGFLAHEVAESVCPEAVTGEKDAVDADGKPEYQGIDQSKLVPVMCSAIQELITMNENLIARIEILENN